MSGTEPPIYHGAIMRALLRRRYSHKGKFVAGTPAEVIAALEEDEQMPEQEEPPKNVVAMGRTKITEKTEKITETEWAAYAGQPGALPAGGEFREIQGEKPSEVIPEGQPPKQIQTSRMRRLYDRLRLQRRAENEPKQLTGGEE